MDTHLETTFRCAVPFLQWRNQKPGRQATARADQFYEGSYGSEHLPKSPKTDFGFELYNEAYVQELARAVRLRQKLRESDEN